MRRGKGLFTLLELLEWKLLDESCILKYSSSDEELFQDVKSRRTLQ